MGRKIVIWLLVLFLLFTSLGGLIAMLLSI